MKSGYEHDIAIIGIGLDVGSITNLNDYWKAICDKKDCIKEFPDNRKLDTDCFLARMGKDYRNAHYLQGAYLESIDEFDYKFFNISFNEAKTMDPNQRLMLQVAYRAVENAGYGGGLLDGTKTGVYIGYNPSIQVYASLLKNCKTDKEGSAFAGNTSSIIAGRIAYFLNLHGPVMMIDSACATSLTALHVACNEIRNGDCEAAIVGAVSLKMMLLSDDIENIGTTSKDMRTRTFDNTSIGTGPGEGAIALLIKDYDRAVKDRDGIYAVIKGSSINHNGHTIGITATSVSAQEEVILNAWEKAGIEADDIGYIEAHGTGTKLGDPTEIQALKRVFSRYTDHKQFCAIGSVKSNVGHLKSCAGLAGLIKCVLAINNRIIPPTNHFELPNHQINFVNSPLYVNDEVRMWNSPTNVYCCGVSSFGINGSNAHVVLCNYENAEETNIPAVNQLQLFLLSAKTKTALYRLLHLFYEYLQINDVNLTELCFNLQAGRGHYKYRIGMIAHTVNELIEKMEMVLNNGFETNLSSNGIRYGKVRKQKGCQNRKSEEECREERNIYDCLNAYCAGEKLTWYKIDDCNKMKKLHLPEYPYDTHRCWLFPKTGPEIPDFYTADLAETDIVPDNIPPKTKSNGFVVTNSLNLETISQKLECIKIQFDEFYKIDECSDASDIFLYIMIDLADEDEIKNLYNFLSNLYQLHKLNRISRILIVISENFESDSGGGFDMDIPFILGMIKSAIWEYPFIRFRIIRIDNINNEAALLTELQGNSAEFFVVYRNNRRYVERQRKKALIKHRTLIYSDEGIYIIVGGLGGIGLKLAKFLVKRGCANIALISRKDCGDFRKAKAGEMTVCKELREIEKSGCHLECVSADVTDFDRMKDIRNLLMNKYGAIRGIMHCAANNEGNRFKENDFDDFERLMKAKVRGVKVLEEITRDMELDFFVLFSSAICITGGSGCSSYIAGNMYLTEFAKRYSNAKNKLVSVQWSAWRQTGLAKYNNVDKDKELFIPLEPVCAYTALEEIIENGCSYITVGKVNHESHIWKMKDILPFRFECVKEYEAENTAVNRKQPKETLQEEAIEEYNQKSVLEVIKLIWSKELGNPQIELTDNYFELGGDSIIIYHIIRRINSVYDIELQMQEFVKHPTINELYQYLIPMIESVRTSENATGSHTVNNKDMEGIYPVTSAQKRMLIQSTIAQDSVAYNLYEAVHIKGNLDVYRFINAIRTTILMNEVFYTKLLLYEDGIFQVVGKCNIDIPLVPFEKGSLDEYISRFVTPFQLGEAPLIRCVILQRALDEYIFVYDVHHIAFDGVSRRLFIDSIVSLYQGETVNFGKPYKDYAIWQEKFHTSKEYALQRNYWIHKVRPVVTEIMSKHRKFNEKACERTTFMINTDMMRRVDAYTAKRNITLFTFLLSVLYVVLYERTGRNIYSIATPVEGRTNPDFMQTIGMFANTIILINTINPEETFEAFSYRVFENAMEDFSNIDYQYEELVSDLQVSRRENSTLFDTMLTLQDKQFAGDIIVDGLEITTLQIPIHFSKFRYNIEAVRNHYGLEFHIDYATELATQQEIDALKNDLCKVIDYVLINDKIGCNDLAEKLNSKEGSCKQSKINFNFL